MLKLKQRLNGSAPGTKDKVESFFTILCISLYYVSWGLSPDSVLWDHFLHGSGDHIWYWGSNAADSKTLVPKPRQFLKIPDLSYETDN